MTDNRKRVFLAVLLLVTSTMVARGRAGQVSGTFVSWLNHPAIAYLTTPTSDPVARLNRKLSAGEVKIAFDGPTGYLRSVLDALAIPIESQIAVFVKDSVQAVRISHQNPRAIFFNDSVAVGWVPGGFIELASQDPNQGTIFYTLEQRPAGSPQFVRRSDCLTCHHSYATVGVPGMLVRSVGEFEVDHRLPLEQRWGGWYVTGTSGALRHRGNVEIDKLFDSPEPRRDAFNRSTLAGEFDTASYLTPSSDIAALMVFDHQMHAINLVTRLGWEARVARAGAADPDYQNRIHETTTELVDYLLFVDEAPIKQKLQGSTRFAEIFAMGGTHDRKGRSLRQLDLEHRLARFPCSYIIDTPQFDALPIEAKKPVYERLWQVLAGRDTDPRYARLSAADRAAVLDILRDTKKEAEAYFR